MKVVPGESGQSVVEYALVVGTVSVVLIGILGTAGLGWVNPIVADANAGLAALGIG